jgi:phosphate transport system substrate-binding protein
MKFRKVLLAIAGLILFNAVAFAQVQLNGAGATFPAVIYSKWFDEFKKNTGVQINYQAIGSGGGIKQITEGTVDFGASDGPMTDAQLNEAKTKRGTNVLHIPTVLGAVVVSYNIPGGVKGLNLDGETLADIFLGKITKWDDAKIKKLNPKVGLPSKPIIVAHRSDGSGTSYIFTDYLSKVSKDWESKVGKGTSVSWPVGLGGKGNDGVAGIIKQTEGTIGYVELAYAVKNGIMYANMKNKAGVFVEPTFKSVTSAAEGVKNMPEDLRVAITEADGKGSYPISGFTWLLVYQNFKDEAKASAFVKFLKWAMEKGQSFATDLYYAPLPKSVVKMCEKKIASITVNGKKVK